MLTQTHPPGIEYALRTTQSMKSDGAKADRDGIIVNRIKGTTILASLVDLASGSPVDYMHCVSEVNDCWISGLLHHPRPIISTSG